MDRAPYLSLYCNSTKQNDNVTMMFPVNLSLQCLRTAALSIVTLNMESRNPMGRVNAENRSKSQKLLRVKGLMLLSRFSRKGLKLYFCNGRFYVSDDLSAHSKDVHVTLRIHNSNKQQVYSVLSFLYMVLPIEITLTTM